MNIPMKWTRILGSVSVFGFLLHGNFYADAKMKMGADAFSVQILVSPAHLEISDPKFKGVKDLQEEVADGALKYKYTTGRTKSFEDVSTTRLKMIDAGFKDAFIVVYKDGQRIVKKDGGEAKHGEPTASLSQEKNSQGNIQNNDPAQSPEIKRGIGNSIVQHEPEFPGGQDSLTSFLFKNLHQPEPVTSKGQWKHEFVSFMVDKKGKIKAAKVMLSLGEKADAEALRIVQLMPDWKPAMIDTTAINKDYVLSIDFFVPDKE